MQWYYNIMRRLSQFSSFAYLNATQFLGTLNDNIFKLLVIFFLLQRVDIEDSHIVLSSVGIIYVLPFLLFSSFAGILADRFSKRNIIVITKALEFLIMVLGLSSFASGNLSLSYITLFLLATHSAIFSPSKYGIIPELVSSEKIATANGLISSFTYLAVILGTFLASFLLDFTGKNFILACLFCVMISLLGIVTSCRINYTQPSGNYKRLQLHFISDIIATLKIIRHEPSLVAAMIGAAFFLFLGAYIQLNMIPYAVQTLGLTDVQGGYLFLIAALGIGVGSLVAGYISGKKAELALTPLAGFGIIACLYALSLLVSSYFWTSISVVFMTGVLGGIYVVPLESYIQIASPKQMIGQVVAATTFLSFVGVLTASVMLYLAAEVMHLQAHEGFIVLSIMTLIVTIIYSYLFWDYITRFVGMILSRLHFAITFANPEKVPETPALYLCSLTALNDTLLILGSQRRRMRFFVEEEPVHSEWSKRLYKILRVVVLNPVDPLEDNAACFSMIKNLLQKGISVCIFISEPNVELKLERLKHTALVRQLMRETGCPLVAVHLDKAEKEKQPRFFKRLMNRIHIPATVSFGDMVWETPVYNLPISHRGH